MTYGATHSFRILHSRRNPTSANNVTDVQKKVFGNWNGSFFMYTGFRLQNPVHVNTTRFTVSHAYSPGFSRTNVVASLRVRAMYADSPSCRYSASSSSFLAGCAESWYTSV